MRRFVLAAFALTVLAACQPATTELTEEQKAEIAAEVNLRLDTFWDVLRNPDYDQILEFFHESPDNISARRGTATYGFVVGSAMDSISRATVDTWESQELTISETNTVVLSHDAVYTLRVGTDAITLTSGETGPTRPWAASYIWVRRNGEWRILLSHSSHGDPVNP